jgi:hypothetical protein
MRDALERAVVKGGDDRVVQLGSAPGGQDLHASRTRIDLELHVEERPPPDPSQDVLQGRYAHVDQRPGTHRIHSFRSAVHARERFIVVHDRDTVGGHVDVELHAVTGWIGKRRLERRQRVLRTAPPIAAVRQAQGLPSCLGEGSAT